MDLAQAFKIASQLAAYVVELTAITIVGATVLVGLWQAGKLFRCHANSRSTHDNTAPAQAKQQLRLWLGSRLVLALELELAADLLRTAINPSWEAFAQLAAVAALRTLLSYILQRELSPARLADRYHLS